MPFSEAELSKPEAVFERARQLNVELADMPCAERKILLLFTLIQCQHEDTLADLAKQGASQALIDLAHLRKDKVLTKPDYIDALLASVTKRTDILAQLFSISATLATITKDPA